MTALQTGPAAGFGGFVSDALNTPKVTNPTGPQTLDPQQPVAGQPLVSLNGLWNVGVDPIGPQAFINALPEAPPPSVLLNPGFFVIDADPTGAPERVAQPQPPTPPTLLTGGASSVVTDPQGPQSFRQVTS